MVLLHANVHQFAFWAGLLAAVVLWESHAEAASAQKRQSPAKDSFTRVDDGFGEMRQLLDEYRGLTRQMNETSQQKVELESRLNEVKRQRTRLFRESEIEKLQVQLHQLTDEREKTVQRRRQLAGQIVEKTPKWRQLLATRLESLADTAANNQKPAEELRRRLTTLDNITRESHRVFGPGGSMKTRQGTGLGRGMGVGGMGRGMGLGPHVREFARPDEIPGTRQQQIQRLEREQQVLMGIWKQNQERLERLKAEEIVLTVQSELGAHTLSQQDLASSPD